MSTTAEDDMVEIIQDSPFRASPMPWIQSTAQQPPQSSSSEGSSSMAAVLPVNGGDGVGMSSASISRRALSRAVSDRSIVSAPTSRDDSSGSIKSPSARSSHKSRRGRLTINMSKIADRASSSETSSNASMSSPVRLRLLTQTLSKGSSTCSTPFQYSPRTANMLSRSLVANLQRTQHSFARWVLKDQPHHRQSTLGRITSYFIGRKHRRFIRFCKRHDKTFRASANSRLSSHFFADDFFDEDEDDQDDEHNIADDDQQTDDSGDISILANDSFLDIYATLVQKELTTLGEFKRKRLVEEFFALFNDMFTIQHCYVLIVLAVVGAVFCLPMGVSNLIGDIHLIDSSSFHSTQHTAEAVFRLTTSLTMTLSTVGFVGAASWILYDKRQNRLSLQQSRDEDNNSQKDPHDKPVDSVETQSTTVLDAYQPTETRSLTLLKVCGKWLALNAFGWLLLSVQWALICQFLRRVHELDCSLPSFADMIFSTGSPCAHIQPGNSIVLADFLLYSSVFVLVCSPLLFALLPETPVLFVWTALVMAFAAVFASCLYLESIRATVFVVAWMFPLCLLVQQVRSRSLMIFCAHKRIRTVFVEKDPVSSSSPDEHADEMRHLIANVAHDLKTPLASFTTGLDFIAMTVAESLDLASELPTGNLHSSMTSLQSCVNNIRSTTAFMLMTINRCIDYTKASKGFNLRPRYETFDLREALHLPLHCMQNVQSRIGIVLKELPADLCPFVISDKQWLQENLLCLLSNAVKYSEQGEVTISVYLDEEYEELDMENDNVHGNNETNRNSDHVEAVAPPKHSLLTRMSLGSGSGSARENKLCLHKIDEHSNRVSNNGDAEKAAEVSVRHKPSITSLKLNSLKKIISMTMLSHKIPGAGPGSVSPRIFPEGSNDTTTSEATLQPTYSASQDTINTVPTKYRKHIQWRLLFEVEDTGIGMSDDAMQSLFRPFKQNQRLAGGTGLGLFSLGKRVEALKGQYGVKHRRDGGQGSLFWFSIPYRPDRIAEVEVTPFVLTNVKAHETDKKPMQSAFGAPNTSRLGYMESSFAALEATINPKKKLPLHSLSFDEPARERRLSLMERNDVCEVKDFESLKTPSPFKTSTPKVPAKATIPAGALSILLVDDSPSILKMTGLMLHRLGYHVDKADNGAVALRMITQRMMHVKRLRSQSQASPKIGSASPFDSDVSSPTARQIPACDRPYDLILMDLQMPVMDGLEAMHRLRVFEKGELHCKRHYAIGLSANSDSDTIDAAFAAGFDRFLPKPFDAAALGKEIKEMNRQSF